MSTKIIYLQFLIYEGYKKLIPSNNTILVPAITKYYDMQQKLHRARMYEK